MLFKLKFLIINIILILFHSQLIYAQKSSPRKNDNNNIKVDEYTKRLVKEMQGQGYLNLYLIYTIYIS